MYTNELLEEKYKAQQQLSQKAEKEKKDYFEIVESEVIELFRQNGWKIEFDKRVGGYREKKTMAERKSKISETLIDFAQPILANIDKNTT